MATLAEGFPSQRLIRMPVDSVARMRALPLARALHPTDIGMYPEARDHRVERRNGSESAILIHCIGGAGWFALGGTQRAIQAGQACVIPRRAPHRYGSAAEQSWSILWLHFQGSETRALVEALLDNSDAGRLHLPRPTPILEAFHDAMRWTLRSHTQSNLIALSSACARLLSLVLEGKRPGTQRARQVEERVRATMERMRETIARPLRLEQLAEEAALSVPHYCALFKQQTGSAPMQLYTQLRIQFASQLLIDTRLSIQSIARESGYDDPYYFSRAFKKTMGLAPTAYRASFGSAQHSVPAQMLA